MFGKNKILKVENHDGLYLDVVEIFPTLQGEGLYAGHPAVFIRLGGCNLRCNFCDTEFENFQNFSLQKILDEVQKLTKNDEGKIVRKLIVITGGEPFRQPITRLCEELLKLDFPIDAQHDRSFPVDAQHDRSFPVDAQHDRSFIVQIETNGTIFRDLPKEVKIICSPKVSNDQYHPIRPDLLSRISAFKFIISATDKNYSKIPDFAKLNSPIPIYVQPMDEYDEAKNQANLRYAAEICQQEGFFLSLQIHKILGIR